MKKGIATAKTKAQKKINKVVSKGKEVGARAKEKAIVAARVSRDLVASAGSTMNNGLNSFSVALNSLNDNYIGGPVNRINETYIAPQAQGTGKTKTWDQRAAGAIQQKVDKYIAGPLNSVNDKYGPVAATGVAVTGAFAAAGSMAVAAEAAAGDAAYYVGAKMATSTAWKKGVSIGANVTKGVVFQAIADAGEGKSSSLRDYEVSIAQGIVSGVVWSPVYSPAPGSMDVNKAAAKRELPSWLKWVAP